MGSKTRKALNFDFKTKDIQENMDELQINGTYRKAYRDVNKYFEKNGIIHSQESSYTSRDKISYSKIYDLIEGLTTEIPYLKDAVKSFHVTEVGRTHDITEMLSNEHNVEIIKPENLYKLETNYGINVDDTKPEQRSIRFDFSGELLRQKFEEYGLTNDYRDAYKVAKKYFTEIGYSHEQGSVYITPNKKIDSEILKDVINFSEQYPYLGESFSSFQITSVGRKHDITDIANGKQSTISKNNELYEQIEFKIDKETNSFEL